MALIELLIRSQTLITETELYVILPENTARFADEKGDCTGRIPTLYLLHGMSDDHSIWLRRTSIERYADEHGVAVVMPCGQLSFYTDMHMGDRYWQFITRELPAVCRSLFPQLSRRREDTFVAGLSMGGYGALKCGLRAPEVFSWAAGLSSGCDIAAIVQQNNDDGTYWQDVFGPKDQVKGSFNDLFAAAEDMAKGSGPKTNFYMWCGTEDFLYEQNVRFRDHMQALGLPLLYEESPGDHQWKYWDEKIQTVLRWLPLGKEEE
ncbi:MAG: esterase family protein [Clostridiales bacterium]|nr:esterase family protein [Clostridiales bacterium]